MINALIVDDEYYIVQGLIRNVSLEEVGIENVFDAYSMSQAQKVIETHDIEIVITDIEMPKGDGMELINWIRENAYNITIIILTGHQRFDYAQKAVALHCYGYILKPVDKGELMKILKEAVAERNIVRQEEPAHITETAEPPDFVSRVRSVIRENLSSEQLNRSFISNQIHMNPDYLSTLFHRCFGKTLSAYINEKRIDVAKELLANTSYSLQQISDKAGFSSSSYFHKQFKKVTGITPQQFRSSENYTNQ